MLKPILSYYVPNKNKLAFMLYCSAWNFDQRIFTWGGGTMSMDLSQA